MDIKLQNLGKDINILISNEINFTTDSILLAHFSSPSNKSTVMEIGSGCGIIPLVWCRNNNANKIIAVEINETAFKMMKESIRINSLMYKITPILGDARNTKIISKFKNFFDMVVCNPPYFSEPSMCKSLGRAIARHEGAITIEEIVKISQVLLKNGGYLCLCCKVQRLCDVIFYMKNFGIEPKVLRFVEYKEGKAPGLFLIKGKKGAKPGLTCERNLIIQMKSGEYYDEVKKIYDF